jgi:stage III sporulation protein AG
MWRWGRLIRKMKKEQLLIGALAGILLLVMAIPVPKSEEKEEMMIEEAVEIAPSIEQQLEEILQQISGVGRTEVLIIYEDDGKVIVEKDESVSEELIQEADSSGGTRTTTTNRNERQTVYADGERPYVIQKISPTIEGVLVVAEGAGNTNVKNQIQQTIEALFGLDAHKISIMKMEVSK